MGTNVQSGDYQSFAIREDRIIQITDASESPNHFRFALPQDMPLLALMGLPGTGKSTIAKHLADRGAHVLDKDRVRAALFGPRAIEYSRTQDDVVVESLYDAARFLLTSRFAGLVVLDGRTYSRSSDVHRLVEVFEDLGEPLRLVECRCAARIARERLAADLAKGTHPARDRRPELYDMIASAAETTDHQRLALDTSHSAPHESVREILRRWPELALVLEPLRTGG